MIRFTPTRVGTAPRISPSTIPYGSGSPPREWGQRATIRPSIITTDARFTPTRVGTAASPSVRYLRSPFRFTPTRVGTASPGDCHRLRRSPSVHPHASGDSASVAQPVLPQEPCCGSPPREWGQPPFSLQFVSEDLGSPPREWGQQRSTYGSRYEHGDGSPPREWGQPTAIRMTTRRCSGRFTPTRVGTANCHSTVNQGLF